jgi:hypothetical protein
VLPMVRVDRLYLGPMSAPDQLGRELLPAVLSSPGPHLVRNACFCPVFGSLDMLALC